MLLANNVRNRKIRTTEVNKMALEIKNDTVRKSTNPISISPDGKLLDGQHRLQAIVKANKPAWLYVAYNVDPATFVFDRGATQTATDSLYMAGVISEDAADKLVGSAARQYIAIRDGIRRDNVADSTLGEFISKHEDALLFAKKAATVRGQCKGANTYCNNAPVRAAMVAAMISGVPASKIEDFASVVNTGLPANDTQHAAVMLRNFLIEGGSRYTRGTENDLRRACAYAQMAIRDFVKGKPCNKQYRTLTHVYINGKEEAWPRSKQAQ